MKEKLFIISDIHGEYDLLEKLLKHWDRETEQLVCLGDLADRGLKSKQCFLKIKELVDNEGAICLIGNHEDILLKWLDDPEEWHDNYMRNGGQATIESLLYEGVFEEETPLEMAAQIKFRYHDLIEFIANLPLYYENDFAICVHAGVNLSLDDWKETSRRDFIWIREEFHHAHNKWEKFIVFGHTPVQGLHNQLTNTQFWFKDKKIGIDGGAVYHGSLRGLVLSEHGIEADYQVYHPHHIFE